MENPDYHKDPSGSPPGLIPISRALKYGAIAGFIATWSITTAIAVSEWQLGLPISTFYSIMGISLGSSDLIFAAYLGFGMHLMTGTILGGIIAILAVKVERLRKSNMANILDPYRAILVGMGTGILVWLALFLPVTGLFVQPSEGRIVELLSLQQSYAGFDGNIGDIVQAFRGIALGAIVFHLVWGAIFGFIVSSLVRIRLSSASSSSALQFRQFASRSLRITVIGLAVGLISSLAISGLILLMEKISSLPVGTFYYVLVSAMTNSASSNIPGTVALGLAMHLLGGSLIGLVMSVPFIFLKNTGNSPASKARAFIGKYSPVYGLAFGFGLWLAVFIPITYIVVVPLLNSFENQDVVVGQRVPTGEFAGTTFFQLLSMMDRLVYGAIVFNMFYGLLTAIMLSSITEKYLSSRTPIQQADISGGEIK